MKIKDVLTSKDQEVLTINKSKTTHDAIQVLGQHNIGRLTCLDNDGKLECIISERDILRESAERDKMLRTTRVFQSMTENVIVGVPEDDIEHTIGVMTKNRIRHLPILENEKIAGIISRGDIVNAQLDEREYDNRYLKQHMFWELKLHFIRDRHTNSDPV